MVLAASAAALAAAALYNTYRARRVERRHPPAGRFVDVDGVRLHYLERGEGPPPVVLLHGNVVTAEDWVLSGVLDRVAERHRVVAFDRPGYGHSDRPQGSAWTAGTQADLLRRAFARLGLERPVVVGHSWGTNAALALPEWAPPPEGTPHQAGFAPEYDPAEVFEIAQRLMRNM